MRSLLLFGVGVLAGWALMFLAFVFFLEGDLAGPWNAGSAIFVWLTLLVGLGSLAIGFLRQKG